MIERRIGNNIVKYPEQEQKKILPPQKSIIPNDGMRLSVSKMQLFAKCPKAFQFNYIEDLSFADEAECLTQGKELHDMFYYAGQFAVPEEMRAMKNYSKYPEHCENFISYLRRMMLARGTSIPTFAEKEIYDPELNVLLYIDRIDMNKDGTVDITDYKTGDVHHISTHRFQLAFYAYFVEKVLKLKVKRWAVFYSKKGIPFSELVSRNKIDLIQSVVLAMRQDIFRSIKDNDFPKRPSRLCEFCSYRQYQVCDAKGSRCGDYFGVLNVFKYGDHKKKVSEV
jgi:CRISPR/Cas system-associated exonuclease Cas4 (RecB family)